MKALAHILVRVVWNSTQKFHEKFNQEFKVPKSRYISWCNISKAFANVHNGRTYVQVVGQMSYYILDSSANHRHNKRRTHIVTVPQGNANAAFVTSPKVSIKPKPSRPIAMTSSSGLKHKVRVQHPADTFSDLFHISVQNSFQALQNLHENLVETQENASSGLEGTAAALAVPVTKKIQTSLLHKDTNTVNSYLGAKNVNTASKHTQKGPRDDINQPHLNTNAKIGVVTQSTSQTDTQQLATLGAGGLQFQPTPESGQAFDSVFSNPHCGTYVREEKIPLYVWNQKDYCKDYKACLSQSDNIFGYVPFTDLKTYTGPSVKWDTVPDIIEAHKLVRQSGVPNFLKCRIPVETNLKANVWRTHLRNYWDQQLPDLLQFGFPLDFHRDSVLSSSSTNHTSAS